MGAKASTPAPASQPSPAGQGFNLLQHVQSSTATSVDRQRARSLSSVPDQTQQHSSGGGPHTHPAVSTAPSSNNFAVVNNNSSQSHASYIQQRHPLGTDGIRVSGSFRGHSLTLNGVGRAGDSSSHTLNFDDLQEVHGMSGTNFVEGIALAASSASSGRVYTATSLPSHIWSFNGIKCPVCNKFVLPDDIECHLVMCLTKPRLSYNEDVLADAKGECVICLEDLNPGDVIARLPCLCIYHKGCIDRWFEVNRTCPEHPGD